MREKKYREQREEKSAGELNIEDPRAVHMEDEGGGRIMCHLGLMLYMPTHLSIISVNLIPIIILIIVIINVIIIVLNNFVGYKIYEAFIKNKFKIDLGGIFFLARSRMEESEMKEILSLGWKFICLV